MALKLEAACGCNTGKIRHNNEDNFLFDLRCLEPVNDGLDTQLVLDTPLDRDVRLAVFDGMGGENYGELASYAAAECLRLLTEGERGFPAPGSGSIADLVATLNSAVVARARELCTEHMGTTMAALFLHGGIAYIINLGDSRAYLLRAGSLQQITVDHVMRPSDARPSKKQPLTQYLGIPPETLALEPYAAKGELQSGDWLLLCSDGLTDMVRDEEIRRLMSASASAEQCVQELIAAALENGGRDNVTVIACRIL